MRKGCFVHFFGFTALLADIISTIEGIESILGIMNLPQVLPLDKNPLLFSVVLFYGLVGISVLFWDRLLTRKILGEVQTTFGVFILYLLVSPIPIFSYGYAVHPLDFTGFLLSPTTIFFFIVLPYIVGRILVDVFTAPNHPHHGQ